MTGPNFERTPDYVSDNGTTDGEIWEVPFQIDSNERYDALCAPATGLTSFVRECGGKRVGAIAVAVGRAGVYVPLEPSHLRNLAAGLLSIADAVDGGSGKQ